MVFRSSTDTRQVVIMEYDKFFVACQMDIQFDPISMGDSGTERRYGIFGNPFFNTMISTMGEHRVKKMDGSVVS